MTLKIEHVVAGYDGGDVLKGVNLVVEPRSITCIVGPNGAGKSTLLRVISGLLKPRHGTITYDGRSIGGLSPRQILELGIVQVPQNHSLFEDMTVRENVRLGGYILGNQALLHQRLALVEELFPLVKERAECESCQPFRRATAPGRVCTLPDARSGTGFARRALDGAGPPGPQAGTGNGNGAAKPGQNGAAGRAKCAYGPAPCNTRRRDGKRASPPAGDA